MKNIIAAVLTLIVLSSVHAQDFPECSELRIERVSLTDSGYIAVEMSNACVGCNVGTEGCTYAEMMIFNRYDASDTIASSSCYCLQAPPNEGVKLYLLPTQVTHLPALDTLRFYFHCSHPICEDLPVSERALSIAGKNIRGRFKIYPNPGSEVVNITYGSEVQVQSLQLLDVSGRVIRTYGEQERALKVKGLATGIYFLNIRAREGYVSERIVIEQ